MENGEWADFILNIFPDLTHYKYWEQKESFLIVLSLFAPHFAEEAWHLIGRSDSVVNQEWPEIKMAEGQEDKAKIAIQVNGKVRGAIEVDAETSEQGAIDQAKKIESVARHLDGKQITKVIFIPGKILNLVVR